MKTSTLIVLLIVVAVCWSPIMGIFDYFFDNALSPPIVYPPFNPLGKSLTISEVTHDLDTGQYYGEPLFYEIKDSNGKVVAANFLSASGTVTIKLNSGSYSVTVRASALPEIPDFNHFPQSRTQTVNLASDATLSFAFDYQFYSASIVGGGR